MLVTRRRPPGVLGRQPGLWNVGLGGGGRQECQAHQLGGQAVYPPQHAAWPFSLSELIQFIQNINRLISY